MRQSSILRNFVLIQSIITKLNTIDYVRDPCPRANFRSVWYYICRYCCTSIEDLVANEVWRRAKNRCLCCCAVTACAWEKPVHLNVHDALLSCTRKPPRTPLSCTELLIPRALAARAFHYIGGALSRELIINSQYTTTGVPRYRHDDAIIHSCSINARVRCSADNRRRSDLETDTVQEITSVETIHFFLAN